MSFREYVTAAAIAGRNVLIGGNLAALRMLARPGQLASFIDGAHSYEYVHSDTQNALRCVRSRGVVAWHDFGRAGVNGVSRAVLELARSGRAVYAVPGGSLAYLIVE